MIFWLMICVTVPIELVLLLWGMKSIGAIADNKGWPAPFAWLLLLVCCVFGQCLGLLILFVGQAKGGDGPGTAAFAALPLSAFFALLGAVFAFVVTACVPARKGARNVYMEHYEQYRRGGVPIDTRRRKRAAAGKQRERNREEDIEEEEEEEATEGSGWPAYAYVLAVGGPVLVVILLIGLFVGVILVGQNGGGLTGPGGGSATVRPTPPANLPIPAGSRTVTGLGGALAYYPFEDRGLPTWLADASGYKNHANTVGSVEYCKGARGKGLLLDGKTGYLEYLTFRQYVN